jgi:hypothetical protein
MCQSLRKTRVTMPNPQFPGAFPASVRKRTSDWGVGDRTVVEPAVAAVAKFRISYPLTEVREFRRSLADNKSVRNKMRRLCDGGRRDPRPEVEPQRALAGVAK